MTNEDSLNESLKFYKEDHKTLLKQLADNSLLEKFKVNGMCGIKDSNESYTKTIVKKAFVLLVSSIVAIIPMSLEGATIEERKEVRTMAKEKGWYIVESDPNDPDDYWITIVVLDKETMANVSEDNASSILTNMIVLADREYWL